MAELNLVQKRKQKNIYAMMALFGIFTAVFYLTSNKTEPITFGFILGDEFKLLSEWSVSSRVGSGIFMVLALFGIGLSYLSFRSDKSISWVALYLAWAASCHSCVGQLLENSFHLLGYFKLHSCSLCH